MNLRRLTSVAVALSALIASQVRIATAADAPTPSQALNLTPIQPLVDYTTPTKEQAAQCTIRPEKENNITSWVVRDPQGVVLRRFADTNNDNVVDQWCYFLNGVEVYRDIDSNYNGKADQYRWLSIAGTRWGIDKNEDGRIDQWKTISPHEVAEQVVLALKTHDAARFQLLLPTQDELTSIGFGQAQAQEVANNVKAAPAAFAKLMADQKSVTQATRFIDFGSARPGTIPQGTGGSTKDVVACDGVAAIVQTGEKPDQVYLGTLVAVGEAWKLIEAPTSDNQGSAGLLAPSSQLAGNAGGDSAPSEEMQRQMAELERLDKEAETLSPDQFAANLEKRVAALQKLAEIAPPQDRNQWYRQEIDIVSNASQTGNYPDGIATLEKLQRTLAESKADEDLIAHAYLQGAWAQYILSQRDPAADGGKVQEKWLADLQDFVDKFPKTNDAAEALYQLAFYSENLGKTADAAKWYQRLVSDFPNAKPTAKATGALYRFNSLGKPMRLQGNDLQGGAFDLARSRGKVVLIHYWATMGDRWKEDLRMLTEYNAKRGGRDFEIVGVCLDNDPTVARQYLAQNKTPWKQLWEKDGLDGRLANEMGVITLPLMILVDQRGNVASANVHIPDLDSELAKLVKPATPPAANAPPRPAPSAANALRNPPLPR